MHIMMIPEGHYLVPHTPLSGIFVSHQVESLSRNGIIVGVLNPALIPFRFTFKKFPYVKSEYIGSVFIMRHYRRAIIPGRFIPVGLKRRFLRSAIQICWKEYTDQFGTPDIIHAHNLLSGGVIAEVLNRQYQIPFLVTEHTSTYSLSKNSVYPDKKELEYVAQNCSGVIAVGSKLLANLVEVVPEIEPMGSIVPNVVDPNFEDRVNAFEFPQHRNEGVIRIVSIGNLIPRKNFKNLIEAFARVFPNGQAHLTIVGEGPEEKKLIELAQDLGVAQSICFLGSAPRDSILDLLLDSDFFVLTSMLESFGVVVIEALSCGLPVVATDCGGPSDILEEEQGFLVPVNDLEALCEALVKMSSNFELFDRNQISRICLKKYGNKEFFKILLDKYKVVLE